MYPKGSTIMIAENYDLRKEVLQACRGLGAYGLGSGIGGHVSARYPGEPYFYINIFDLENKNVNRL